MMSFSLTLYSFSYRATRLRILINNNNGLLAWLVSCIFVCFVETIHKCVKEIGKWLQGVKF